MPNNTHVLYRFYDRHEQLLYVGITNHPSSRFRDHSNQASWYSKVARATLEYFNSRQELEGAEIKAIQAEKPKYNRVYSVTSPPSTIGISSARAHSPKATSVFGADANRFQQPDAIACDDTDDIETLDARYPPQPPRIWQPFRCLVCHSNTVFREYDDLVRCDRCLNMWLWDEWHDLNLRFPKPDPC